MPAGRPTTYNAKVAAEICAWLAGGKSLREYCRQDDAPALSTVCLWIVTHDEFSVQYRNARQAAGYAHADRIADIVDNMGDGLLDPNVGKAMMDGLKWSAERMAPKSHMPQSLVNHQSPDGSMSPKPNVVEFVAPKASDEGDD